MQKFLSFLFICSILSMAQAQQHIRVFPDKDNTLIDIPSSLDTNSNGIGPYFFVGRVGASTGFRRRAVLHFDIVSMLPSNAIIDSVKFHLYMSQAPNNQPQTFSIKKLTADWGEGNSSANGGTGATAQIGDATWIHSFYNQQIWNQAGGDFDSLSLQTFVVADTGHYQIIGNSTLVNLIQDWQGQPSTNFGWIIIGNETTPSSTKRFSSRENSQATERPQLDIWYRLPNHIQPVLQDHSIKIYPNPINQASLQIESPNHSIQQYSILNSLGQIILERKEVHAHQFQLNVADLPSGIYHLKLVTNNHSIIPKTIRKI